MSLGDRANQKNRTRVVAPIVGRTISKAEFTWDGASLSTLELGFADGTTASFLFAFNPGCEGTFYENEDDEGRNFKVEKP